MNCSDNGCGGSCGSSCGSETMDVSLVDMAAEMRISQAAERLGCLLAELPEFQQFLSLGNAARVDPQVMALMAKMHEYPAAPAQGAALEEQLEALPAVVSYQRATDVLRDLFTSVDQLIADAAELPFAENAVPRGGT